MTDTPFNVALDPSVQYEWVSTADESPDEGQPIADPKVLTDIPFYSVCAHHFLPFFGVAHVAYLPGERIIGLSKLARVVEFYARRPQIQERMTEQIIDLLEERLRPAGAMVVIQARHFCMEMRGIGKPGLTTTTSAIRGAFEEERVRREFLTLLGGRAEAAGGVGLTVTPTSIRKIGGY